MNIQNKLVNISGVSWGAGSMQTVSCVLLCGMSGTQVIPLQVSNTGYLIQVSGAI